MGLDLRLLPFYGIEAHVSFDVLDLERRADLWNVIAPIQEEFGRDVPENFNSFLGSDEVFEETCYGKTILDAFNDNVKYLHAKHLKLLRQHTDVQDNWKNKAVWAFLEELPDDLPVALYWH